MTAASHVLPLETPEPSLSQFGGKGRALAAMASAGLPIPRGFVISTAAYVDFVAHHGLQSVIERHAADALEGTTPARVEQAATQIRRLFESAPMPTQIAAPILQAYDQLAHDAVAVRSSATAEDLPEASFAGQQDTFLNVRGPEGVLDAVRACWSSLWTARAMSYRAQVGVDPAAVSMAVVVQEMVDADVAGVLFTADPVSGDASTLVINAALGLGEALVGGVAAADTYVVERKTHALRQSTVVCKAEKTVAAVAGGTAAVAVPRDQQERRALADDAIEQVVSLALRAEDLFGGQPQDVEWAMAAGRCWLLQARPLTGPSTPGTRAVWEPPPGMRMLVRRQVVENMPEPLSPLFEDLYLQGLERGLDRVVEAMGWPFRIEDFMARPMCATVHGYGYSRIDLRFSWRLLPKFVRILFWFLRSLPKLAAGIVPAWRDQGLPAYLAVIEQWKTVDTACASDETLLAGVRALSDADAEYWFQVSLVVGAAKTTDGLLGSFLARWVKGGLTSGAFLRGYSSSTWRAQEDLAALAGRIGANRALRERVLARPADQLVEALGDEPAGRALRSEVSRYMQSYGHQVYNLDFAELTQAEDPGPVLASLQALVRNPEAAAALCGRQVAVRQERDHLTRATSARLGPLRRRIFVRLLDWAGRYGPYREEALFYMGAAWPTLRRLALTLGARLAECGSCAVADDVFYLTESELKAACAARAAGHAPEDLGPLAAERHRLRRARRALHPPGRVPENLRFELGPFDFTRHLEVWETQKRNPADATSLTGFGVSPGKVTGIARVILSPADFADMVDDAILVCPTTTPAWTPLFGRARGLVTDIGAILAHGSIVAREYGIPAVLGTGSATTRIVSGQRITVDGSAGIVTIHG